MEVIKRFLADIRRGENLDLYFFVIAALSLAILNGIGQAPSKLIESVTLALLGLLSAYSLGVRERLTDINDRLTGANTLLYDEIPFQAKEAVISEAKEIIVIGITLNRFVVTFYSHLEEKVRSGQKVKVLLVEPNSEAIRLIPQRVYRPTSEKLLSRKIMDSIELLHSLKTAAPDLVEVRTLDFPIPFGCVASNIDLQNSSILIEYYSYKTPTDTPCVLLSKKKEPHWHSVYRTQVLNLWDAGKTWTARP